MRSRGGDVGSGGGCVGLVASVCCFTSLSFSVSYLTRCGVHCMSEVIASWLPRLQGVHGRAILSLLPFAYCFPASMA